MTARLVQERLNAAGFGPLAVDGQIGPATIAALDCALAAGPVKSPDPAFDANDAQLAVELERDERYVSHAYQDSRGFWTIGIGRLIDKAKGGGITREEALYLKRNDIARFKGELDKAAPWWRQLDPVRQRAVLNMTFNLGSGWITPGHEKAWPNTVALIKARKFAEAAAAIRANKVWVGQVGDRALRIAKQIETGL
ncbi:MAG: lysozyme [Brevundimonas sp.]|nr:MAG: lysozyme [Brevundimonas sp.]